jgi:3-oxoadipate enol-lactonase
MRVSPSPCTTLVEEWKAKFAAAHTPSMLLGLDALNARDSIEHRLGEIDMPSLVIVGEEDISLPPAISSQIAAALGDSSLITIPQSGHLSALEQPEAVTEAMLDFLAGFEALPE